MKKYAALILALFMLPVLAGCNKNDAESGQTDTSAASPQAPVPVETLPEESTEATRLVPEEAYESVRRTTDLTELKYKELEQLFGDIVKQDGGKFFGSDITASDFAVVSSDELSVGAEHTAELFRQSSNMMFVGTGQRSSFDEAANAAKRGNSAAELSEYAVKDSGVTVKLAFVDGSEPTVVSKVCGYTVSEASFCAFVSENKDGTYDVIIDPAYMYNIPVPVFCTGEYSVGGRSVLMDSVSFTAPKLADKEFTYSGHVYAQMTVKNLNVEYDETAAAFPLRRSRDLSL